MKHFGYAVGTSLHRPETRSRAAVDSRAAEYPDTRSTESAAAVVSSWMESAEEPDAVRTKARCCACQAKVAYKPSCSQVVAAAVDRETYEEGTCRLYRTAQSSAGVAPDRWGTRRTMAFDQEGSSACHSISLNVTAAVERSDSAAAADIHKTPAVAVAVVGQMVVRNLALPAHCEEVCRNQFVPTKGALVELLDIHWVVTKHGSFAAGLGQHSSETQPGRDPSPYGPARG